jgi:hypothetical protein
MYTLISLFAASLLLIAVFFAIKEREVYKGSDTALTRLLRRHSPGAERLAHRLGYYMMTRLRSLASHLSRYYERLLQYLVWGARALVVMVAQRMIHAVKGEKLLSSRGASSMYLKHLKEHKDNAADDVPQV